MATEQISKIASKSVESLGEIATEIAMIRLGNGKSAQSFSDQSFWKSFRVVDVRAFGSWMSVLKCLFSRILTALTEVLGRDMRANDPRMSAGCPSQKLPLWADFSFLIDILEKVQGATRLGATGLRASERKSASERVPERTSENL